MAAPISGPIDLTDKVALQEVLARPSPLPWPGREPMLRFATYCPPLTPCQGLKNEGEKAWGLCAMFGKKSK
jgi:hypothetical protein